MFRLSAYSGRSGFHDLKFGETGRALRDDGSARCADAAAFHDRSQCVHVGFLFCFCRLGLLPDFVVVIVVALIIVDWALQVSWWQEH
jgi:hypothetical protein